SPRQDESRPLSRDLAADGLGLLGDPDRAHAALADRLQQLVAAGDDGPDLLGGESVAGSLLARSRRFGALIDATDVLLTSGRAEPQPLEQGGVGPTGLFQEARPVGGVRSRTAANRASSVVVEISARSMRTVDGFSAFRPIPGC